MRESNAKQVDGVESHTGLAVIRHAESAVQTLYAAYVGCDERQRIAPQPTTSGRARRHRPEGAVST